VPTLRELQEAFARALEGPPEALAAGLAVYRECIAANYRGALGASFPVVRELLGEVFFDAAVDAFVAACPPQSGDLNVLGDRFGDFLADYGAAASLAHVPDVARLEWAMDEALRAADATATANEVAASLAHLDAERVARSRLLLHPSCRLLRSCYPVLQVWKMHQPGYTGSDRVELDGAHGDRLLVRREGGRASIERLGEGEHEWLCALAEGAPFAAVAQRRGQPDLEHAAVKRLNRRKSNAQRYLADGIDASPVCCNHSSN